MELLIDKKYLLRLERYTKFGYGGSFDPFAARYVFALPPNAGLPAGYTVYIDAAQVVWEHNEKGVRFNDSKPLYTKELEHDKTYRLDRSNNAVYIAKMTENREEGKRYKQYKYTAEELYSLYQNVDLSAAELTVAKIDIYVDGAAENSYKLFHGNRIESTDYYIGKRQGCWFYCSELDTKRRIGSHGVTILGKIRSEDEAAVVALIKKTQNEIKQLKENYTRIYVSRSCVDKALWAVKNYCDEKNSCAPKNADVLTAIQAAHNAAESAMQLIDQKLSEEDTEILKIRTAFEEALKNYVI